MALKNIGVLLALCATLTIAVDYDDISPPTHGPHNPHFPVRNREESTSNENQLLKEHHGHHNPHHTSEEPHKHHGKWEHNHHHHGGHSHDIPHNLEYLKETNEVARRRPLGFYPFGLYHPYRPYANPSNNDEEFEAIEARASGNHNGPHNPHFPLHPLNSEESGEAVPYWFFHHKPHFPLLPFFKPTPRKPESNHDNDIESDGGNIEGSGEEEIIPLFDNAADIPLLRNDLSTEYQYDDQYEDTEPSDVASVNLISLVETRKSIPIECDALNSPRFSCYNCYNYIECKVGGGKIKSCKDPYAPYCNNGICSDVPGPDCSNL